MLAPCENACALSAHTVGECSCLNLRGVLAHPEKCSCHAGETFALRSAHTMWKSALRIALHQTSYYHCFSMMQLHMVTRQRPVESPLKALQMHNRQSTAQLMQYVEIVQNLRCHFLKINFLYNSIEWFLWTIEHINSSLDNSKQRSA